MRSVLAFLVAAGAAGCVADEPVARVHRPLASAAVAGDLSPGALVVVPIPARAPAPVIAGSDPVPSALAFDLERRPRRTASRDFTRRVPPGAGGGALALPLDAPDGASVVVSVAAAPGRPAVLLGGARLRSADGRRLDRGRDDAASRAVRVLSVDRAAAPGIAELDLPVAARAAGAVVLVRQPRSAIELGAAAGALFYARGETARVTFDLARAGEPLDGAAVSAWLEKPGGRRAGAVAVVAVGDGRYVAEVPLDGAVAGDAGVWTVHGKAVGAGFERDAAASFGVSVPHARLVTAAAPRLERDAGGTVVAIELEVTVESTVADRLALRGTLVATADGHAVAAAQTGVDVAAGIATLTLRFAAEDVALAGRDGPYVVRDLALVSHGDGTLQHRLGLGAPAATPFVAAAELRRPERLRPAIAESLGFGTLAVR